MAQHKLETLYEYIASRLPEFLGPTASGQVVVAHLGHGASMCAMRACRSLATTMGMTALDGLVFTGGIGEHASAISAGLGRDAAWLGVVLDKTANDAGGPRISAPDSKVAVYVIATNEDLMIARHALRLLKAPPMGTEKGVSR